MTVNGPSKINKKNNIHKTHITAKIGTWNASEKCPIKTTQWIQVRDILLHHIALASRNTPINTAFSHLFYYRNLLTNGKNKQREKNDNKKKVERITKIVFCFYLKWEICCCSMWIVLKYVKILTTIWNDLRYFVFNPLNLKYFCLGKHIFVRIHVIFTLV